MAQPNRPLRQVAFTVVHACARHWSFWLWLAIVGLIGFSSRFGWPPRLVGGEAAWSWMYAAFFTGLLAPIQLADFFTDYRWRLVPHYRRNYLAAGGILAAGMFALLAVPFVLRSAEGMWPDAGLALLMFSLGCWAIVRRWIAIVVLGSTPLLILGLMARVAIGVKPRFFYGWPVDLVAAAETWQGIVACTVAGGLLLAWFARRLANLTDDDAVTEFWRVQVANSRFMWSFSRYGNRVKMAASDLWIVAPLLWLQEWRLERALRRGGGLFAWNVRRWDLASMSSLWLLALIIPVVGLFAMPNLPARAADFVDLWATVTFWVCGTLSLIGLVHFQHQPTLGIESLRPVSRAHFVRQRGVGLLSRLASLLVVAVAMWVIAIALWPKKSAPPDALGWFVWGSLWMALPLALMGLVAWLRTIGPPALEKIAAIGGIGLIFLFLAGPRFFRALALVYRIDLAVVASVGLLLIGIAFFWSAYRRWLVMDLE